MTDTARRTRPLDGLRAADESEFGGKSAGLGELLAAGISVPPGFAVSAPAFRAFLAEAGLERTVAGHVARVDPGDVDSVDAASRAIAETLRSAPVPDGLRVELEERYTALGPGEPPVAVRSSALGEDSAEATFAGQQETYLWVRGADHVCEALRDCWISLYSAPALSYRSRLTGREPAMGVTVQLMVDAQVSGVLFTCNPVSGDPSMVAINASWGLGLAVVGGEVTPDDYLVSKVTREVVRGQVSTKEVQYVPAPEGRGAIRVEVPTEQRDAPCLDVEQLRALAEVARRVERHFGSHQDVEWAIDRDGVVHVLQSRPVTAQARRDATQPADALSLVMSTFGATPRESS
jgi:pyruvate,water dikinase